MSPTTRGGGMRLYERRNGGPPQTGAKPEVESPRGDYWLDDDGMFNWPDRSLGVKPFLRLRAEVASIRRKFL